MTSFRVAYKSCNLQGTDRLAQVEQTATDALLDGATVIGWQEAPSGHDDDVAGVLAKHGWMTSLCYEVPISWKKDVWTIVGPARRVLVHKGEGGVTPDRWIHIVRLCHRKSGRIVTFINTHVVHHIETSGRPMVYKGAEREKFKDQAARARLHFRMLRTEIHDASGPCVYGGDFNVDFYADKRVRWHDFPYSQLSGISHFAPCSLPTEGNRMIDWIGYRGQDVTLVGVYRKPKGNSDHYPPLALFDIKVHASTPAPAKPAPAKGPDLNLKAAIASLEKVTRADAADEVAAALRILKPLL